jgi:lysyl-tRNA synthetase class 2
MLPSWHPDEYLRRKPYLQTRQRVMAAMRAFFAVEDFVEVDTPVLQISPGNEVHLHAFKTEMKDPRGEKSGTRYLHTSPEFAMKKLLVAGVPRLYQFAHTFRNGERSSLHHPEFLMLEWYRAEATLQAIKDDCIALVRASAQAADRAVFSANGMVCDPFGEWDSLSIPDAFRRYADIDLLLTMKDPYVPDIAMLASEAKRIGMRVTDGDGWDDLFFRILGEKIEPHLGKDRPTFLGDYPVSQAALARPKPDNPALAERFELYICGIELANAFGELTDAEEQRRRFELDMDEKEKLYGERYPVDADFIAALEHGMPQSSGIALGFDRLLMLASGATRIEDVLWLPVA